MKSIERRQILHNILEDIVSDYANDKTPRVFYNSPGNKLISYPCIIYRQVSLRPRFADNRKYYTSTTYELQVLHRLPDDPIIDDIYDRINSSVFLNSYTMDNIIHTIIQVNTGGLINGNYAT